MKVPEIPAGGVKVINMLYGNEGAMNESDGEAVFEFFDDFNDGTVNSQKWDVTGSPVESGGKISTDANNYLISKMSFSKFDISWSVIIFLN